MKIEIKPVSEVPIAQATRRRAYLYHFCFGLRWHMASPLPGSGPVRSSDACDRQFRLRGHNSHARPRRNVDTVQEAVQRHTVRPSSASCQACTSSGAPGDGHDTTCSSSQLGVGPSSSNSAANGNVNGEPQASSSGWGDAFQPEQHSSSQPVSAAPGLQPVGTVVICGWLGSNKRYLKRYQDWWTQNRCCCASAHSTLANTLLTCSN